MAPSLRPLALSAVVLFALAAGCAGPPIPSPIEGEPVCPDVTIGTARTAMIGGLRYPVRLRILDGKSPILKMILGGLRTADETPARTLIADDDSEYTVEWAQCPNERAPRPIDKNTKPKDPRNADKSARVLETAAYECGEAVVYKTTTLATKKGDAGSHTLKFEAPPKAECWVSDAPPAAPDAGAPPPENAPAPADADAGAGGDAGPVGDAGPASDAGTAASAAPDAGPPPKK
jgi:hypothetical protein